MRKVIIMNEGEADDLDNRIVRLEERVVELESQMRGAAKWFAAQDREQEERNAYLAEMVAAEVDAYNASVGY
jgi:predicted  nucleic acid-binding Zn-ribbon protein